MESDAAKKAREIVEMIGNVSNRRDIKDIQQAQFEQIMALVGAETMPTLVETWKGLSLNTDIDERSEFGEGYAMGAGGCYAWVKAHMKSLEPVQPNPFPSDAKIEAYIASGVKWAVAYYPPYYPTIMASMAYVDGLRAAISWLKEAINNKDNL